VIVLWNQEVHTDKEVMANRPGIVVKDREDKTRVLMGVAVPADRNITAKGSREETKVEEFMYRDTANV
jgi:hypothetical protein